jgi:hypothetical protein
MFAEDGPAEDDGDHAAALRDVVRSTAATYSA